MSEDIIRVDLDERSYDIVMGSGVLPEAGKLLDIDRRCLIVTDDGVPEDYSITVAGKCARPIIVTLRHGESSKSLTVLERLLRTMMRNGFTRNDCVIAVGGGMAGDIAGLAAALYMRGIDFYNIPTTVLSQADSSIGGKTAVNIDGIKNMAGAFWQPRGVLIDTDTLYTLPCREFASGLAEIIKSGMIANEELFGYFERTLTVEDHATEPLTTERILRSMDIRYVLRASLEVKRYVIEHDEREADMRRILNFGHTIGHGIESTTGLLHGECVALGMIAMSSPDLRPRLTKVLERLCLPTFADADPEEVFTAAVHDKKTSGNMISAVFVDEPGRSEISSITHEELKKRILIVCRKETETCDEGR